MKVKIHFTKLVVAILFLLLGLLVFLSLIPPKFSTNASSYLDIFNKVIIAEKENKNIELNSEDTNALINLLLKNKLNHGALKIKGIYSDIKDNTITLFVPLSYKNVNLVASTKGQISYKNNKLIYKPQSIKIGKLLLPKSFLSYIGNYINKKEVSFSKEQIEFDSNIFPFKINSFEIKNSLILVSTTTKSDAVVSGTNGTKNVASASDNLLPDNATNPNNSGALQNTSKPDNNSIYNLNSGNYVEKEKKLTTLYDQLLVASKMLKSAQEVQVMSMMENVIQNMMKDSSYNYTNDVSKIKQCYSKLTNDQKGDIKASILSNVDLQNAKDLQQMLY